MKDEWTEYLRSVGFHDPLLQRADSVLRFYNEFAGIAIDQIFVSEYLDSDKGRVYQSLWVFSEDYIGEALIVGEERLDLIPLSRNFDRFEIKKTEFDFGDTATDAAETHDQFHRRKERRWRLEGFGHQLSKVSGSTSQIHHTGTGVDGRRGEA